MSMECPGPETLAAHAESRLSAAGRETVLDHLAGCDDCRQTLLILQSLRPAAALPRFRSEGRRWIPWAAAAAIFAVCIVGVLTLRPAPMPAPETAVYVPKTIEVPPAPQPTPTPKPVALDPVRPPERPPVRPEEPTTPKPAPAPEAPTPAPEPPKPSLPAPTPEAPKSTPTSVVVAVLGRVEGDVAVLSGTVRTPAKAGVELRQGDGLDSRGARSSAILLYPDKTRVELEGDTLVRELHARDAGKGLRVVVDRGAVRAEVAKQPAGQPMLFETPYGEARVLGTILRVGIEGKSTRLDVEEGRVELRNAAGKSSLVEAGHFAVASATAAPSAKRYPKEEFLLALDFEDGKRPASFSKGTVVQGPDRRACLYLEGDAEGGSRLTISDENGLFVATGQEILSFDYWTDPQASGINVNLWNRTAKQEVDGPLPKITTGKWAHATFRLGEIGDVHIKEGDWIISLLLQATGGGSRKLYIDNLVLSRPRSLKPGTPDSK